MSSKTRLFEEAPELRASVPWRPLADVPTPVEPATAAEGYLGRSGIWIKRDDRISPVYGGNKVRRFEHLIADAEQRGAKELITVGGLASTQVIATALFGAATGFRVTAVLFDQPLTSFARRALLTNAGAGARLLYGGGYARTAWRAWRAFKGLDRPYFIAPGASSPMANLGYVSAMLELADQVEEGLMPRPDIIVLPAGSGGTLAGLAVGVSILGWPTRLIAVRITELIACNRATLRYRIESTARYLARRAPRFTRGRSSIGSGSSPARFSIHHGAIGRGYGYPTPEAIRAIPAVEQLTGAPGEVTYSGKAMVGLRSIARENPTATILYWHTLSSAALGDDISGVNPESLGRDFAPFFEGGLSI